MTRLLFWLGLTTAGTCLAADKDPCTVSKLNASKAAYDMLEKIAVVVPFDRQSYFLYESQDPLVKGRAVSRLCNGIEKWILYDPAYIESIREKDGDSGLPFYFVLAHEAAHHVLDHTLRESNWDVGYWGPKQELDADHSAAMWITRAMRVNTQDFVRTLYALGIPEQADLKAGYPSRALRLAFILQGYWDESSRNGPEAKARSFPPPPQASEQRTDPFRNALQRRIEEVRTGEKARTPLPDALRCDAGECVVFSSFDLTKGNDKFRELATRVEEELPDLPGQNWTKVAERKLFEGIVDTWQEIEFKSASVVVDVRLIRTRAEEPYEVGLRMVARSPPLPSLQRR